VNQADSILLVRQETFKEFSRTIRSVDDLETFCRQIPSVTDFELLNGQFRVSVEARDLSGVRVLVRLWKRAHNCRDLEIDWVAIGELVPLRADPEFEEFCRAVPGVTEVTLLVESYCVSMQAPDVNPIKRQIHRWMKANGRDFNVSMSVHASVSPSTYDPMDRAISSMTYVHKPEA